MLVKNWYSSIAIMMFAGKDGNANAAAVPMKDFYGNDFIPSLNTSGTQLALAVGLYLVENFSSKIGTGNQWNGGIVFGIGTEQPTIDDYTIQNMLTTISVSNSKIHNYKNLSRSLTYTIVNNDEVPITITEYGFVLCMYGSSGNKDILLTHSLLDIPVTIQPGETGVVVINETISALSQ